MKNWARLLFIALSFYGTTSSVHALTMPEALEAEAVRHEKNNAIIQTYRTVADKESEMKNKAIKLDQEHIAWDNAVIETKKQYPNLGKIFVRDPVAHMRNDAKDILRQKKDMEVWYEGLQKGQEKEDAFHQKRLANLSDYAKAQAEWTRIEESTHAVKMAEIQYWRDKAKTTYEELSEKLKKRIAEKQAARDAFSRECGDSKVCRQKVWLKDGDISNDKFLLRREIDGFGVKNQRLDQKEKKENKRHQDRLDAIAQVPKALTRDDWTPPLPVIKHDLLLEARLNKLIEDMELEKMLISKAISAATSGFGK